MGNPTSNIEKKKRKFSMPGTPSLLLIITLFVALLSYIVPAGTFERVFNEAQNRTLVVPGTYAYVDRTPVSVGQLFASVFEGLMNASDLIAFVFVVGGAFYIVQQSGAINAGLGGLIKRFRGREYLLIAILMIAFSVGGATFGMAEETLPFVVLLVTVSLAMGFDKVVGVSMVLIGVYCGYSAGPLNPFNTGVAQKICELPLFSGLGLRVVLMLGALVIAIHHVIRYCNKLKKGTIQPALENDMGTVSEGTDAETAALEEKDKVEFDLTMTGKHKAILIILAVTIIVLVFGVIKFGWYFSEISALFFAMGLVVGFVNHRGNFNAIAGEFIDGAAGMASAALLMGLSRAILVVAEQGQIMDTIVYAISIPLSKLNSVLAAWGMYLAQGVINFLIPSSSGQAVVVMPIMSALSDLIGVTRQTSVLAFSAGDGFWNMITPTHSVVMASLGLAGLSFGRWFKFALPLVAKWSVWIMAVLAYAAITGWGPF